MRRKRLGQGIIPMNRIREVLRLDGAGFSQREIAQSTKVSRTTIQNYLQSARIAGVTYETAKELSDTELRIALNRQKPGRKPIGQDPDFEEVHKELQRRKGTTLALLWKEWSEIETTAYSYVVFCRRYRTWARAQAVVMRHEYRGGEFALCDYAGETLSWWDDEGQEHKAEIFVGVLGASNYTYAGASVSQKQKQWKVLMFDCWNFLVSFQRA